MSENHKVHILHKIIDINAQIQNISSEIAEYLMSNKQTNVRKQKTYNAQRLRQRQSAPAATNKQTQAERFFETE